MRTDKIVLAYCHENYSAAYEIERDLTAAGYEFKHIKCSPSGPPLNEKLTDLDHPVLLLISDNFLKSQKCMLNVLQLVQEITQHDKGQIIITDGEYNGLNGAEKVTTKFDRVSHVIHYMNYWQDQYLDMRQIKRDIPLEEQEAYEKKLKVIREISGQIGELLRFIKEYGCWTYEQFSSNSYRLFFTKYGTEEAYHTFRGTFNEPVETFESLLNNLDEKDSAETGFQETGSSTEIVETINKQETDQLTFNKHDLPQQNEEVMLEKLIAYKQQESTKKTDHEPKPVEEKTNTIDKIIEEVVEEEAIFMDNKEATNAADNVKDPEELALEELFEDEVENTFKKGFEQEKEIIINVDDLDDLEDDFEDDDFEDELVENEEDDLLIDLSELTEETTLTDDESHEPTINDIDLPEDELPENDPEPDETEEMEAEEITAVNLPVDEDVEPEEMPVPNGKHYEPVSEKTFNTKSYLKEVDQLFAKAKGEQAFAMLESAMVEYPENNKLKYHYAIYLDDYKNDTRAAIAQLEQLIELEPGNQKVYSRLAEIAEKHHDFLLAKNYYEKVLELDPDKAGVYHKIGHIYLDYFQDKEKKAAKAFHKAYKLNNNLTDAHFQYALLLAHYYGKPKKATKEFEKLIDKNPENAAAYYELALIQRQLGKRYKTRKYFNKACKLNPALKTEDNKKLFSYKISYRHETPQKNGFAIDLNEMTTTPEISTEPEMTPAPELPGKDKVVFITGATSGIGLATAEVFARNGYRLILNGRRSVRLEQIQDDFIARFNSDVLLLPFDVRSIRGMEDAVASLENEWQNIDILINNAGLAKGKEPIHEGRFEDWNTMIDTNIKGLLYLTRAVAPQMVENKSGHIINICSSAGHEVYPGGNVYCATKHAVDALTKGMRLDLFRHNIRVSQVSPGHVEETEFAKVRYDGDMKKAAGLKKFQPLKAKDVAEAIYFIVSQPPHVTIQDVVLMATQQANNIFIDESGRKD